MIIDICFAICIICCAIGLLVQRKTIDDLYRAVSRLIDNADKNVMLWTNQIKINESIADMMDGIADVDEKEKVDEKTTKV